MKASSKSVVAKYLKVSNNQFNKIKSLMTDNPEQAILIAETLFDSGQLSKTEMTELQDLYFGKEVLEKALKAANEEVQKEGGWINVRKSGMRYNIHIPLKLEWDYTSIKDVKLWLGYNLEKPLWIFPKGGPFGKPKHYKIYSSNMDLWPLRTSLSFNSNESLSKVKRKIAPYSLTVDYINLVHVLWEKQGFFDLED